jgi:magnesium-transporting ATPase (P-type)
MKDQGHQDPDKRRSPLLYLLIPAGVAALLGLAILIIRRLRARRSAEAGRVRPAAWVSEPLAVGGLTEEEARARFVGGRDNAILFKPPRSRRTLIRESALTVFNLGLVSIALVQLLFGKPLDALISIGVLIFSVIVSVFQNEFARLRLRELYKAARTAATVIRDEKARNVDPAKVVVGDAVAIGPGDLILGDGYLVGEGQLVVDESMVTGERKAAFKSNGDPVFAGSFCLLGRGIYEAEFLGEDRAIVTRLQQAEEADLRLTPIEQIIRRVMIIVLIITFGLTAFAILTYFRIEVPIPTDIFIDVITVILNLAPASLFFMIVLTYTAATADLSQFGALVARARSVEELSQVDAVVFSKSGMISGANLTLTPIVGPKDPEVVPEHRIRQLLGDFSRTISSSGTLNRLIVSTFEGTERPKIEEMPFAAIYGWEGLVIDDEDMRGVFILGEPELLEANLVDLGTASKDDGEDREKSLPGRMAGRVSSIGSSLTGLFRRSEKVEENKVSSAEGFPAERGPDQGQGELESGSGGFFRRLAGTASRLVSGPDETEGEQAAPELEAKPEIELLFAYHPDTAALYGRSGEPILPSKLIPLCRLDLREQVQPEAVEAAKAFDAQGVTVKIFSPDPAEKIVRQLSQAGLGADTRHLNNLMDGGAMTGLSGTDLAKAVWEHSIFSGINFDQAASLIRVLRQSGATVAVIGDNVTDIPALLQANLTLIRHTSDPAALSVADIVLTDDSPTIISKLLGRGRWIVNGLLDVLKLYLTQIFYTIGLIILIQIFATGFPYTSAEGGMIAVFTLTIPAIGVSIWADKGKPPTRNLARLLTVFVIPAALTIASVGLVVYLNYYANNNLQYAQTVLMHALVAMGLILVLFIHPPVKVAGLAIPSLGDIRPAILAMISAVLFFITTQIPLAQELLKIDPLKSSADYWYVLQASVIWAVVFFITLHFTGRVANLFPSTPDLTKAERFNLKSPSD